MPVDTLVWIKDIFFILLFLIGTLWFWGVIKLRSDMQEKGMHLFRNSHTRFKWLFLAGLVVLVVARLFRMFW